MSFFKKNAFKNVSPYKVAILLIVGVVIIVFAVSLIGSSVKSLMQGQPLLPFMQEIGMGGSAPSFGYATKGGWAETAVDYSATMPTLSLRNTALPIPPSTPGTTGNTAEKFEVTDYSVNIETQNRNSTCVTIAALKSSSYVIFENAQETKTSCSYSFKVEKVHVNEILGKLKALNPKELSENTYTIKNEVDDFESEVEILTNKLDSIDETLSDALDAYDEIAALATKTQDASSLAKIIDSKIQIIERLSQEKINIQEQLDRIMRAKAQQLDRVDYSYFSVYVYENKFVDPQALSDSWKQALKDFVVSANRALQDATLNLVSFVLFLLPYLLYLLILLVVGKVVWKTALSIWHK